MAKYRKCKLSWKPSNSDLFVGYKLYWSKEDAINYDSNFIELGNVCEVIIPDIFKYPPDPGVSLRFGVSAVDLEGNESDIVLLAEMYQASEPAVPLDLSLKTLNDFAVIENTVESPENTDSSVDEAPQNDEWDALAKMAEPLLKPRSAERTIKYYDDVGYRKLEIEK
jgi:hypothetical protein